MRAEKQPLKWGGRGSNPRPTDYESLPGISSRRKVLVKDLDCTVKRPLALKFGWLSQRRLNWCPSITPWLRA